MKSLLLATLMILLVVTSALARGPQGVSKTRHNLSSSSPFTNYSADNESEVCIFCHTPHGGSLSGPLWNRDLPDTVGLGAFTHYDSATFRASGGTYTGTTLQTTRAVSNESMLCLSCHDGAVAMNSLLNYGNYVGVPDGNSIGPIVTMLGISPGAVIGAAWDPADPTILLLENRLLGDDHPISFSYSSLVAQAQAGQFYDLATVKNNGIRLFPNGAAASDTTTRVECSSCHDPHVDYSATGDPKYRPFLIKSNEQSNLCLSCHIK